jgi:excisionase family DNA binding protein
MKTFTSDQKKDNQVMIAKPYLSLEETCTYLSLSKPCLYSWTSKKINLPFHKIGKRILFKRTDLDEFIESRRIKPKHEIEAEALREFRRV